MVKKKKSYLFSYIKPYLPAYIFETIVVSIGFFLVFSLVGVILQQVVEIISGNQPAIGFEHMILYAAGVAIIASIASLSLIGVTKTEQKIQGVLIESMLKKYMHASEIETEPFSADEILNRMNIDVPKISTLCGVYMSIGILEPIISGLLSTVTLLAINWAVALLCIGISTVTFGLSQMYVNARQDLNKKITEKKSEMVTLQKDLIYGAVEVRTYHLQKFLSEKQHKLITQTNKLIMKFNRYLNIRYFCTDYMSDCMLGICILVLGWYLSRYGMIRFSYVMLAIPLSDQIGQMIRGIGNFRSIIKETQPNLDRVYEVLSLKEDDQAESKENNDIVLDDVSFSYGEKKAVNHVSLHIHQGERLAIVGESGSGKSTLLKLIMGLYKPAYGTIQTEVLTQFRYVPQFSDFFHCSVANNIAMSMTPDLTMTEKAADKAEILKAINLKPEGMNYVIGEMKNDFSGGELQRISLARALYKKDGILVFDEPTASLDPETATSIQNTIMHLGRNKTVITVTHQLSFVKDYDCICFMEKGKIIAKGTHEELMKTCPSYKKDWLLQSRLSDKKNDVSAL